MFYTAPIIVSPRTVYSQHKSSNVKLNNDERNGEKLLYEDVVKFPPQNIQHMLWFHCISKYMDVLMPSWASLWLWIEGEMTFRQSDRLGKLWHGQNNSYTGTMYQNKIIM